jgi:hypothetical protein
MSALTDSMDELQSAAMTIERDSLPRIGRARVALIKVVRAQLVAADAKPEALAQFDKQHKSYLEMV